MAPGPQLPLSRDQMRRAWALVDVLTSFKRRPNNPPPTAEWILRKFDALERPALEALTILVDHTIAEQTRELSRDQVWGMVAAVRAFPEETASEVAHAHARGNVVSDAAVKRASLEASYDLRLGLMQLEEAQKMGVPLCPIATDRYSDALTALTTGKGDRDSTNAALEILGDDDAVIQRSGSFLSSKGLLTGTALLIAVMDRLQPPAKICCGSCLRIASADELLLCRRCGDHLACRGCLEHAQHANECLRVRSKVRSMAQSLTPHIRESARRVAVVQLGSFGLMVPALTTSIASPLIASSFWESLLRCSAVVRVAPCELQVHWRLLVSFLAEPEGDDQEAIDYEGVHHVQAGECALEANTLRPTSRGAPRLLPSERRRLRKEIKRADKRAQEEAHAAAEATAMAEANAVLNRQSARPDATSSMLTSVLLKRGGKASPEVVARTRAKRDSLKAAEMWARKHAKAKVEEPNATEQKRINRNLTGACFVAAAILLQRRARTWLRCRKKLHRKERSRAAKRIQSSVRTWLLRTVAEASITVTAGSNGCEGTDGEEPESAEPEPPKPASTEPAATECAICLDDAAEFAVIPCGHRCLCARCIKAVSDCPMCRGAMTAVLRVFI